MKLLNNHVSIITGAASGIGFSIAKKFLENGARVVLNDRNAENLTKSEQSLTKAGFSKNNFFTKVGDVTYEDDMEKLFDECSERFSSCSLLVNNAGIVQEKPFMQISTNDWDQMLATHLKGCFLGCQYALRSMLKKKSGVIINIASQLGQIGGFELAHYSAAKAGIIGLTKSLWNDDERYIQNYWNVIKKNLWVHGDLASKDKDGHWYLHGRSDDTIKVSGKRIGPSELESVIIKSGKAKEVAAVGIPDEVKGSKIILSIVPLESEKNLNENLFIDLIIKDLGKSFKPDKVIFVRDLPKTRNMKIMRRIIKSCLTNEDPGDISTLLNPESVEEFKEHAI